VLTLVGGGLRFATLGVQSYWADEGFTVAIVHHGLGTVLSAVRHTESTPPLYYFVAWNWSHVFGTGVVGLRSLSALCGTLTIPVAFATASEFFSRRAGLICAALLAFSPVVVWYAQEARAYSLLLLLGSLSTWLFAKVIHGDRRSVVWWGVSSALAIATHYFALFLVLPEAAWLLATQPSDRRTRAAVTVPALVLLALVPLLVYQDQHVRRPWTTGYGLSNAISGVAQGVLVGPTWTPLTHRVGVALLALLVISALVFLARDRATLRQAVLPIALLVVSIGVPVAIAVVATNYVVTRNVILDVPLGLAIIAAGIAAAPRAAARVGLTCAICGIGCAIIIAVPLTPAMQRPDWRDAIRAFASPAGPRLWVFLDRFDSTPIARVYLPNAQPLLSTPVPARELVVVGTIPATSSLTTSPVAGFELVELRVIGGLRIFRFSAVHARKLSLDSFNGADAWIVAQRH
jgi:4-amino-4-deoxy-L-arabinose transferase-like glycosyltransferase